MGQVISLMNPTRRVGISDVVGTGARLTDSTRSLLGQGRHIIGPLGQRCAAGVVIMGIVNATPDSFSDGYPDTEKAIAHGLRLLDEGAGILDIGGESTKPGANVVDAEQECNRVLPVIRGILAVRPSALISIDTSKPSVAEAALDAGAQVVNDVSGLSAAPMRKLVAQRDVEVVIMHMRGRPKVMQQDTHYTDLQVDVDDTLTSRAQQAMADGVGAHRIFVDPGIGFGKKLADNPKLLQMIPTLCAGQFPVLIGASRKAFIGETLQRDNPTDRVFGSIGVALAAVSHGAAVLRVHDVAATADALTMYQVCR